MKRSVLDYLENTAKRCPERIAWDAAAPFTFGQWWDAAQRIASSLSSRCALNTPVAVLMNPRSAECVKVFFGVWAAGCFYAPLDPMLPPERLKLIMQNLQPTAIVYDEESRAKAEAVCPDGCESVLWSDAAQSPVDADKLAQIRQTVTPDHLAAILYTSGSTGIPKGVAHTQGSLMAYTEETIVRYQFTENTVFGNQSPFFYANSIIDIFPPALLGAKACMIPATALSFPKTLVNYLRQKGITELTMTPSSFVQVANSGVLTENCLPELEYMIMSGEVMPWAQLAVWMNAAPKGHAWNFYGSTEMFSVSVGKVEGNYEAGQLIPVGKPFPTVKIRFMTDEGAEAAPGEAGEMYVSSPMVSQAYYRDEERSRAVYVADPLGQEPGVWFRSGDYGFLDAQGQLNVLGRKDSMVKHHGYRMELGEVEAALRSIPGCLEACCLLDKEQDVLWAFAAGNLTEKALMDALKTKLARYMLPDKIVLLPELPHTANMKIDRQTLRKRMTEQG